MEGLSKMDKKEFLELRDSLQQFEEEHYLELSNEETPVLISMINMITEYIVGLEE